MILWLASCARPVACVGREHITFFFGVRLINLILKSHVPALRCWERKDMDHIQGWTFQLFKIPPKMMLMDDLFFFLVSQCAEFSGSSLFFFFSPFTVNHPGGKHFSAYFRACHRPL